MAGISSGLTAANVKMSRAASAEPAANTWQQTSGHGTNHCIWGQCMSTKQLVCKDGKYVQQPGTKQHAVMTKQ